jgi:hypothetical protein
MKKGLLFGFGLLLAGSALAATLTVDTVSVDSKNPGDFVSNEEFNLITSGINAITTMFNDATDNGATITVPKTITATSLSAPEVCIGGDCQSAWPAEGSGVSDQSCDTGYVVKGITGGDFDCVLDQNDGGASSPIGTLESAKWCWSPDGITLDCNRTAPALETGSVDYQYWQCLPDGKTYWYTSAGVNMAIVKEDCTSLGGCINGEIGGTCINAASGGTSITPLTCDAGEHLYKANSDGTFVCSADTSAGGTTVNSSSCNAGQVLGGFSASTGNFTCVTDATGTSSTSLWEADAAENLSYTKGMVGIGVETPVAELDVSATGGTVLTQELCLADGTTTPVSRTELDTGAKSSLCLTRDTILGMANLFDKEENGPGLTSSTGPIACNSTQAGKTRVRGPMDGGATYEYQVCMYNQNVSEWYWMTLLDSMVGIPTTGDDECSFDGSCSR